MYYQYHPNYIPPNDLEDVEEEVLMNSSNIFFNSLLGKEAGEEEDDYEIAFEMKQILKNNLVSGPMELARLYMESIKDDEHEEEEDDEEYNIWREKAANKLGSSKQNKQDKFSSQVSEGSDVEKAIGNEPLFDTIIKRLNQLKELTTFNTGTCGLLYPTEDDEKIEVYQPLTSFERINELDILDLTHPLFDLNFINEDIPVKDYFEFIETKRVAIVLHDDSGSMETSQKKSISKAFLYYMAEEIEKQNCIMYYSKFVEKAIEWFLVDNTEKAIELASKYRVGGGGNTEIGECLIQLQTDISKKRLTSQKNTLNFEPGAAPQIIIINDGQDEVIPINIDIPVHSIVLFEENLKLKNLCIESKGSYNFIKD